jgi:hypothetical protein
MFPISIEGNVDGTMSKKNLRVCEYESKKKAVLVIY